MLIFPIDLTMNPYLYTWLIIYFFLSLMPSLVFSATSAKDMQPQANLKVIKLTKSERYPAISNWWSHGYTGKKGVLGIIDEGVDPTHVALRGKRIIFRKEDGTLYHQILHGVRSPHGTGVACIYASKDEKFKGIAFDVPVIISGPSGKETPDINSFLTTVGTINWMLERTDVQPTVINYSMGNGLISCKGCAEWSMLARIIDDIVNKKHIMWVTSAGNQGYVDSTNTKPFASTLTVPAENYNALTVANMNTNLSEKPLKNINRRQHSIRSTSSRGPTPLGRRKPDITAPGHDTVTCAPDPKKYHLTYDKKMGYKNGFRRMGGTSAAAPHVGAAILLLQDAGIVHPVAIKALLINSADAWTDSNTSDENKKLHYPVNGTEWNRTYGWGYLNMQKAFEQRHDIIEDVISPKNPVKKYKATLEIGQKITLVHERRVGYFPDSTEWKLSHLSLELFDAKSNALLARDDSQIDTVHQVSNCKKTVSIQCDNKIKNREVIVKVQLMSSQIDGASEEPFAIVIGNVSKN